MIQLSNFHVITRLDVRDRSMGMLLYSRTDSSVVCDVMSQCNHIDEQTQTIQCNLNGLPFCFTYVHPTRVSIGLRKLAEIALNEIIVGDLNADYLQPAGHERITKFSEENRLVVSSHGRTHNDAQLDHVLIPYSIGARINDHIESFCNQYSDHRAICIRLSKNASSVL